MSEVPLYGGGARVLIYQMVKHDCDEPEGEVRREVRALQGYLSLKKMPIPYDHHRALSVVPL